MSYVIRPTKYTLYRKGDSPIFGESVTELALDDEAGGLYLTISQTEGDFGAGGTLRLDFEEIPQLIAAIELLHHQAREIEAEELQATGNGQAT